MADIEGRLSPSCLEEIEEEALDPRVQVELERLNGASEDINKLELALDDARASFRQSLTDSTHKLDLLAKKLGSCVDKARPYYEARHKSKEIHVETQKAAYMYERACSMHEAAKEMVQLAEQGYAQRDDCVDPAWQEMLNHATMKVNDAEAERHESEKVHLHATQRFKEFEEHVQYLQKDLKRSINKSKLSIQRSFLRLSDIVNQYDIDSLPYFEMKARFNQMMEDQKKKVNGLEYSVTGAKKSYSEALRNLEQISEEIHSHRLQMKNEAELGVRGAGVGSESPSPPPMRGKEPLSIDGNTSHLASSCSTSPMSHLPSVIHSTVEKSRSQSYRDAIEARRSVSHSVDQEAESLDNIDECLTDDYSVDVTDDYLSLPQPTQGCSCSYNNTPTGDDIFHVDHKMSAPVQREVTLTDAKNKTSLREETPATSKSTEKGKAKKSVGKLKGLILTPVGAGLDPLQLDFTIKTKPQVSVTKPKKDASHRPSSYPNNTNQKKLVISPTSSVTSSASDGNVPAKTPTGLITPGSDISHRKILKVPSMHNFDDCSDTESITSGTMLDDDQVEFLTLDFSEHRLSIPSDSEGSHERRLSLPPSLSHLESYARKISETSQTTPTFEDNQL